MPFSRNALFCKCLHRLLDNSKSFLSIALKFCVQFYKCLSYILLFFWSFLWTFSNLTFFIKLSNFGKLQFFLLPPTLVRKKHTVKWFILYKCVKFQVSVCSSEGDIRGTPNKRYAASLFGKV